MGKSFYALFIVFIILNCTTHCSHNKCKEYYKHIYESEKISIELDSIQAKPYVLINEFSNREKEIYSKTICKIVHYIKNPTQYFIYSIKERPEAIHIHLLPLAALQSYMQEYKKDILTLNMGPSYNLPPIEIVFGKDYNILTCYPDSSLNLIRVKEPISSPKKNENEK